MPHSHRRDPDRLFPADPRTRAVARDLHSSVAGLPIVSPHGHVRPELLLENIPFVDATELLIDGDHYVTRLLHADGLAFPELGYGSDARDPRALWQRLAERWHLFAGTASGYWLEEELSGVLGINEQLTSDNADRLYEEIGRLLAEPEFRPAALFERFGIEVLATTDDPLDDLRVHAAIADSALPGRVIPTFRPDRYIDPTLDGYADHVLRLLDQTGSPTTFVDYLEALRARRQHFIAHGATSADHGVQEPFTVELDATEAERLFSACLSNTATATERRLLGGHMLFKMAAMSVEDGLAMTIHAGVLRGHHRPAARVWGPDAGHDIPVPTSFTGGLRPLLERFGFEPGFHLVLFTVDETTYSREIAPLAGFYPSVFIGAPWWFLDAPDAIQRFRAAVTETAGFSRGSGFIDDTRAFLSIPARHETARRADASYLARLVAEGRLTYSTAESVLFDIVSTQPRKVFKL